MKQLFFNRRFSQGKLKPPFTVTQAHDTSKTVGRAYLGYDFSYRWYGWLPNFWAHSRTKISMQIGVEESTTGFQLVNPSDAYEYRCCVGSSVPAHPEAAMLGALSMFAEVNSHRTETIDLHSLDPAFFRDHPQFLFVRKVRGKANGGRLCGTFVSYVRKREASWTASLQTPVNARVNR